VPKNSDEVPQNSFHDDVLLMQVENNSREVLQEDISVDGCPVSEFNQEEICDAVVGRCNKGKLSSAITQKLKVVDQGVRKRHFDSGVRRGLFAPGARVRRSIFDPRVWRRIYETGIRRRVFDPGIWRRIQETRIRRRIFDPG
jgi:hypothetical protein